MCNQNNILKLLQTKSRKAFCYLYKKYSPALYGLITKLSPDAATAGNILQNSLLHIWLNIDSYVASKGSLFSWMVSITLKQCGEILHQQKNELIEKLLRDILKPVTVNISLKTQVPIN